MEKNEKMITIDEEANFVLHVKIGGLEELLNFQKQMAQLHLDMGEKYYYVDWLIHAACDLDIDMVEKQRALEKSLLSMDMNDRIKLKSSS